MKKLAWEVIAEQDRHIEAYHGKAILWVSLFSFGVAVTLVTLVCVIADRI